MYPIPETLGDDWLRILAIDPGSSTLGVAIMDWRYGTELARVRWAGTITIKNTAEVDTYEQMRGKRDKRIDLLKDEVATVLDVAFPNFVITETSFSQRSKANAYESGLEVNCMLRQVLWDFSPAFKLHGINPRSVKNYVGVSHVKTDKEDMKRAVISLYSENTDVCLEQLDEHSIDAIAVGNFFVRFHLLSLNSLYVAPPKVKGQKTKRRRRGKRRKVV